jgi:5-methylcytosine-specific restriction protein A
MPTPHSVEHEHVIEAIRLLNAGEPHLFGDSTHYDLLHDGYRYPPKAILGLAGQVATGKQFKPADFTGGEDSTCFKILRRCGFLIVPKIHGADRFASQSDEFESDGPLEGGKKTRFITYWSVPLKNWTGNKLDSGLRFRHSIRKGGPHV